MRARRHTHTLLRFFPGFGFAHSGRVVQVVVDWERDDQGRGVVVVGPCSTEKNDGRDKEKSGW